MDVSVLLLTKNAQSWLERQLQSIRRQAFDGAVEVLAVDSGSSDNTLAILRTHGVKLLPISPGEFGHGRTRNFLAGKAQGRWVVFLTQDAIPANGSWLSALLENFEDPQVAGAFSRQSPTSSCPLPLRRQMLQDWPQVGGTERIVKCYTTPEEWEADKPRLCFFANTSSAVRRDVLCRIPFPEVDFGEDACWAEKVLLAGYSLVYEPASVVIHSHDYSLREHFRQNYDYGHYLIATGILTSQSRKRLSLLREFCGYLIKDSRYLRSKNRPVHHLFFSSLWHLSGGLGRLLGEFSAAQKVKSTAFSRQERLKRK